MNTELLLLKDMFLQESEAEVIDIGSEEGVDFIVLNRTVFYPQGGGQPFDTGTIKSSSGLFNVSNVRSREGVVKHYGSFESGSFNIGDTVFCSVDKERRELNSRVHSAGHVLDMALANLGYDLKPGKGFHAPEGPYVEYGGDIESIDTNKLKEDLDKELDSIVGLGGEVSVEFMPGKELNRLVKYGILGIFCGGTHVRNIKDIKGIYIRKIKKEKGIIRIAYGIKD